MAKQTVQPKQDAHVLKVHLTVNELSEAQRSVVSIGDQELAVIADQLMLAQNRKATLLLLFATANVDANAAELAQRTLAERVFKLEGLNGGFGSSVNYIFDAYELAEANLKTLVSMHEVAAVAAKEIVGRPLDRRAADAIAQAIQAKVTAAQEDLSALREIRSQVRELVVGDLGYNLMLSEAMERTDSFWRAKRTQEQQEHGRTRAALNQEMNNLQRERSDHGRTRQALADERTAHEDTKAAVRRLKGELEDARQLVKDREAQIALLPTQAAFDALKQQLQALQAGNAVAVVKKDERSTGREVPEEVKQPSAAPKSDQRSTGR